jgi:hypothetical protein
MKGILAGCKTCLPLIVLIIGAIAVLTFLIILNKKDPAKFKCVIFTTIIAAGLTLVAEHFILPRIIAFIKPRPQATEEWMIYDTDPRNDTFIKGRLSIRELKRLDSVLLKEKANEGMPFDNTTLEEIAKYDPKIIEAYWRWRKCKDMRRSYHKTIYPDERQLYHYLR